MNVPPMVGPSTMEQMPVPSMGGSSRMTPVPKWAPNPTAPWKMTAQQQMQQQVELLKKKQQQEMDALMQQCHDLMQQEHQQVLDEQHYHMLQQQQQEMMMRQAHQPLQPVVTSEEETEAMVMEALVQILAEQDEAEALRRATLDAGKRGAPPPQKMTTLSVEAIQSLLQRVVAMKGKDSPDEASLFCCSHVVMSVLFQIS